MKSIFLYNKLFLKRLLSKIPFLIFLFIIPFIIIFLNNNIKNNETENLVGIYAEKENEVTNLVMGNLVKDYGSVQFIKYTDKKELINDIKKGEILCGYVFKKDIMEKITNDDMTNIIDRYSTTKPIITPLINEYIFAEVFNEYTLRELTHYLHENTMHPKMTEEELCDKLRETFMDYYKDDSLFTIHHINKQGKVIADTSNFYTSYLLLSVKGITSLLVMFFAMIGTFYLYKDREIFIKLSKKGIVKKTFLEMSEIFSSLFPAFIFITLGFFFITPKEKMISVCIQLFIYTLISLIYFYIIYKLLPNIKAFMIFIPLLIIGSILMCPIFIDLTEIIPTIKYLSWLFLPKYYLMF